MTARKEEIKRAYEMAIGHFGFEKALVILKTILATEVAHQIFTEQMAEAFFTELTAA